MEQEQEPLKIKQLVEKNVLVQLQQPVQVEHQQIEQQQVQIEQVQHELPAISHLNMAILVYRIMSWMQSLLQLAMMERLMTLKQVKNHYRPPSKAIRTMKMSWI